MTPPLDLAALRSLAEKATPGPWRRDPHDDYIVGPDGENIHWDHDGLGATWGNEADAAFIAAFDPTTAAVLLSGVEALRRALARLAEANRSHLIVQYRYVHGTGGGATGEQVDARAAEVLAATEAAFVALGVAAATEPAEREAGE